tara:strand:- start:617 stop:742 length:126 start_codon:yes stop_codon:yes gene_type:complete
LLLLEVALVVLTTVLVLGVQVDIVHPSLVSLLEADHPLKPY